MDACRRTALFFAALAPAVSQAQSMEAATELDAIVVQAQAPTVVEEVDTGTLQRRRVQALTDLDTLVPSLVATQTNGVNSLTLRGIGSGARHIGFAPRVGVYLDGVYIGDGIGLTQSLLDLETVHVWRGPQGMRWGRHAAAGAIQLTSLPPSDVTEGMIRVGINERGGERLHLRGNLPLGDRWSAQAGVAHEHQDGWNTHTSGRRLDGMDRRSGRATVRGAFDTATLDVAVDGMDLRQVGASGDPVTGFFDSPLLNAGAAEYNTLPWAQTRLGGGSATWTQDVAGGALVARVGYRTADQHRVGDIDYSAADLVSSAYNDAHRTAVQQLHWSSEPSSAQRFAVGVEAEQQDAGSTRRIDIGQDLMTLVPVPGQPNPLPFGPAFGLRAGLGAQAVADLDQQAQAVWATWDQDWTERWTTYTGLRVTRERAHLGFDLDGSGSGGLRLATVAGYTDRQAETFRSPLLGISYALNDAWTLSAQRTTGFKSGGWNVDFLNVGQVAAGFSFAPERSVQHELTLRGQAGRWQVEAAIFDIEARDYQVAQFVEVAPGVTVIQLRNAASVSSRGLDAKVQGRWGQGWTLGANLGLLDATFKDFPNGGGPGVNLAGRQLPEAPRTTVGLDVAWEQPWAAGTLTLDAGAQYRSEMYAAATNLQRERIEGRTVVDVGATYAPDDADWSVRLWVDNATNARYTRFRGRDVFGHQIRKLAEPRTVGLDWEMRF